MLGIDEHPPDARGLLGARLGPLTSGADDPTVALRHPFVDLEHLGAALGGVSRVRQGRELRGRVTRLCQNGERVVLRSDERFEVGVSVGAKANHGAHLQ